MDELWKRYLATCKLKGVQPSMNPRVIVEGLNDFDILSKLHDSDSITIHYVRFSMDKKMHNKSEVVKLTAKALLDDSIPVSLGLVDMDNDVNGHKLNSLKRKMCDNYPIDSKLLDDLVRDTREKSCIFSLISGLLDDNYSWLKNLDSTYNMSYEWAKGDYLIVIAIAKIRTYLHMLRQSGEKPPSYVPQNAYDNTSKSTNSFSYNNWLELYLKHRDKITSRYLNDHCLESTICDYIKFQNNSLRFNQREISSVLRRELCKTVVIEKLDFNRVLSYIKASNFFL